MDEAQLIKQKEFFLSLYQPPARVVSPEEIALESAIVSAVRRNPTYSRNLPRDQENELVRYWRNELIKRGSKYLSSTQTVDTYVDDIINMRDSINAHFGNFLHNSISNGIRIAQCQKSLAIYLKYMWCQNCATVEPPLCPIDRTVLLHCEMPGISWTHLDDVETFRSIITSILNQAQNRTNSLSAAEWELCLFNARED